MRLFESSLRRITPLKQYEWAFINLNLPFDKTSRLAGIGRLVEVTSDCFVAIPFQKSGFGGLAAFEKHGWQNGSSCLLNDAATRIAVDDNLYLQILIRSTSSSVTSSRRRS